MKMNRPTRKMGLAVLAGGLAFVGAADAKDVVVDGSFENATPNIGLPIVSEGGTANPGVGGGWTFYSTYLYSTCYTLPGPPNSGLQYLRPYPAGTYGIAKSSQCVTQMVSLTATTTLTPNKIDSGLGQFTMSAWFSTYETQGDYSILTLEFLDDTGADVAIPLVLGGQMFVANLPTGPCGKYTAVKDWGQDSGSDTIPFGARTARITIAATSVVGAPDGYVDLVSLDLVDVTETRPIVTSAQPANNAIHVGPVVNISITLQDQTTAVNPNSIQLFLDNSRVTPTIQKATPTTTVQYAAGLLPALSAHTYKIVFSDNGMPVGTQTNQFQFTVADYLTLPASLGSPLGSEDASQPGFNVKVYQVDTLTDPMAVQANLTESIELSEAVLAGLLGDNVADLTLAATDNTFLVPDVINWVNSSGATANFPNDQPFPGIPGTSFSDKSFVDEVLTFVSFPASGFYQMGVNNNDQFRLSAGTVGCQTLRVLAPTNVVIPCVAIATNITQLLFGGSLPLTPLTAPVVYATPSGNPDDSCTISSDPTLAGKIVLLDRGTTNCNDAMRAEQAQSAGAVAVLMTTPGDTGFPIRLGDVDPNVNIPVAVIAENYGGTLLKSYLTAGIAVTATIGGDATPRIAEWDGPKGFGAADVTVGFAVPAAGVYPMRLVAGHRVGGADLEWFTIQPDGTRILLNDTSNPDALLAFAARNAGALPVLNPLKVSGGMVTISWKGVGTLEEATLAHGPWCPSPNQNNPQTAPVTGGKKFYRIRQL